jgi:hypothetical protein
MTVLAGPSMSAIGTPTIGTSANYNNRGIVTIGSGDGYSQDSLATDLNDLPHGSFVFLQITANVVAKYITAWNSSAVAGRSYLYCTASEEVEHFQGDDAAGPNGATTGALMDLTIPSLAGFEHLGQSSTVFYRRDSTDSYTNASGANNVGSRAGIDLFGWFISRPLGSASGPMNGTASMGIAWTDGTAAGNAVQNFLIIQMAYTYYAPS